MPLLQQGEQLVRRDGPRDRQRAHPGRVILAEEAAHRELPMPPWMFGVIALLAFAFLLGLTWSFRGTAYKVRDKHSNTSGGGHH